MSIHILHFEPSLIDAQLVSLALKADLLNCKIEHVDSFEDFEEALDDNLFDLLLCEYQLSNQKTLVDAIDYLKSKLIRLPVIVVSKFTESTLISNALASGVSDYVFKSHTHFLAAAIRETMNKIPHASRTAAFRPSPMVNDAVSNNNDAFLKNLEMIRAQVAKLPQPTIEPPLAPTLSSNNLFQISELQQKLQACEQQESQLRLSVESLNANNFQLQNQIEKLRAELQLKSAAENQTQIIEAQRAVSELAESNRILEMRERELSDKLAAQILENEKLSSALRDKESAYESRISELSESLKITEEREVLSANEYETERQASIRLKAELLEKLEREKDLLQEVDKAQEAEMQLRIELQEAIITGDQLRQAVSHAESRLREFQEIFNQYEAQVSSATDFQAQLEREADATKAALASLADDKRSTDSQLLAAQESAREMVQKLKLEINRLQAELADEKQHASQLSVQLAESRSAVSQLRADCEQADNDIAHLEENLKIVESSFEEKQQKLAETHKQMRLLEQRLKEKSAILDSLNLALIMVNANGEITYWNEGAAVFHATPTGEALGKKSDAVMKYKYASSKARKNAMESLQSTGRWDGKVQFITPDGEQKFADMFISRLNDEVGNSLGVLTVITDTTKRAAMEAAYQHLKNSIEPMLRHAPICIFSFDERGIITGLYGSVMALQKLNPNSSNGKSIYELYGKNAVLLEAFRKTLSGEHTAAFIGGKAGDVELLFAPIRNGDVIEGAVGVAFEPKFAEARS